jgi:tetratricopeptide (TPR) repeat protein
MRSATALLLPALALGLLSFAPAARADTIELTDGRIVEGMVMADPDGKTDGVWVISRFGPTFVAKADIKAHTKARPVDEQIKEYLARLAPKDVESRVKLADWMGQLGRAEEAKELARQILEWAPENKDAHRLLGHVRFRGNWVTPDEAKRAEGYEKHGDKWYTPEEWKNVSNADREKAEAAEKAAQQKFLSKRVNEAVRLALSPDPAVRARGKSRLLALNAEFDDARLKKLVAGIDEYIQDVDELRRKASAAARDIQTQGGMVMGEIRATLSRLKRPIELFETSLASGPSVLSPNSRVKIQLPELEVIKVRTTMAMPGTIEDDK